MTEQERIERLAEWYHPREGRYVWMRPYGWNPLTRIQDSMMLLDHFGGNYIIHKTEGKITVWLEGGFMSCWCDTVSQAICAAVEKLMGERK